MDCLGNGKHFDENGQPIEIYCEECNYLMLCRDEQRDEEDMMNMFKFFDSLISSK